MSSLLWALLSLLLCMPAAAQAQSKDTATHVPEVVGMSKEKAMSEIMAEGLVMGKVAEASSAGVPMGKVISQSPIKGTSVAPGTAIDIVISTGPATSHVPNVVGLTQKDAQAKMAAAELTLGAVTPVSSSSVPIGNIIGQNPPAGTALSKGAAVNLVISSGPP